MWRLHVREKEISIDYSQWSQWSYRSNWCDRIDHGRPWWNVMSTGVTVRCSVIRERHFAGVWINTVESCQGHEHRESQNADRWVNTLLLTFFISHYGRLQIFLEKWRLREGITFAETKYDLLKKVIDNGRSGARQQLKQNYVYIFERLSRFGIILVFDFAARQAQKEIWSITWDRLRIVPIFPQG